MIIGLLWGSDEIRYVMWLKSAAQLCLFPCKASSLNSCRELLSLTLTWDGYPGEGCSGEENVFLHEISLSFPCSIYLHPKPILPIPRGDSGPSLQHGHWHVEPGLHHGWAVHRLPSVPWGEWSGAAGLHHGGEGWAPGWAQLRCHRSASFHSQKLCFIRLTVRQQPAYFFVLSWTFPKRIFEIIYPFVHF